VRVWGRFVGGRLLALVLVTVGLVIATFSMVRLVPGDPTIAAAGITVTPAERAAVSHQLGLDRPFFSQLGSYTDGLLHGNLGKSFVTGQPVTSIISQRIGSSLTLAAVALALSFLLAIPIGLAAAAYTAEGRHPRTDAVFTGVTSVFGALPQFLVATFLAFIFAVWLKVLPVAGSTPPLQSLILPAVAVALAPTAILARVVRSETLNVLAQDYIRTVRSKRLPTRLVYFRHVLPNVLTTALTLGGVVFSSIIAGAVIVENVFSRNGIGTVLVGSVQTHDYQVVQGTILVLGLIVVVVNTLVDVSIGIIDPKSGLHH
jgi:peptide/nickel transport system permease protein